MNNKIIIEEKTTQRHMFVTKGEPTEEQRNEIRIIMNSAYSLSDIEEQLIDMGLEIIDSGSDEEEKESDFSYWIQEEEEYNE